VTTPSRIVFTNRTVRHVRRTILLVVIIIAGLSFAFSFGTGWQLGIQLGEPRWISPLISPAVDLSVLCLIISIQYVRAQGITSRLIGARCLLAACGLITFVLNTARPMLEHQFGHAAFSAVAPALLIAWGEVAPGLLALLHSAGPTVQNELSTVRDEEKIVPNEKGPSAELVAAARQLDAAHRTENNRPITRDALRTQLRVSSAVASELIRIVRTVPNGGDPP
jgi:hypothetical protein